MPRAKAAVVHAGANDRPADGQAAVLDRSPEIGAPIDGNHGIFSKRRWQPVSKLEKPVMPVINKRLS
jgi:hypothetical protein